MVRYLLAALAALCFSSVHAQATQAQHQKLATFAGEVRECFEKQLVDPQFYAASRRAVSQMIAVGGFNVATLQEMEKSAFQNANANPVMCNAVQASGYELQNIANQAVASHNADQARLSQAATNFGNSVPKPIYCNRIGTMTMCN